MKSIERSGIRGVWRLRLVLATVVVGWAGCGTSSLLGPDAPQGVEGIALRGPTCPVVSQDDPCDDVPYEASIDVRRRSGELVTTVRTGPDGRFRVGLVPGLYTLVPESGDPFPIASDVDIEVVQGSYTDVTIHFDTGIR